MNFEMEITDFPSTVHKHLYFAARRLTPLDRSLTSITDSELRLSCTDFYGFIAELLSDMYDHPAVYDLPVGLLENFCGEKKVNAMKQKFPSKTKKILSQTGNPERSYLSLLWQLGRTGHVDGQLLTLSPEALGHAGIKPIDKRFEALSRIGFVSKNGGFVSTRFPHMFPAMCTLARKADKTSGFDFFAFCNMEFRNITGKYTPTYKDYFHPLFSAQQKEAQGLHDFARQHKMTPAVGTYWKVDYLYKGMKVMFIASHACELSVHIVGTYNYNDPALINNRLEKQTPAFQKQALHHVRRCDACATTHLGMFVTVLGKRQRVCGGGEIAFKWNRPTETDFEIIKKLIALRIEIIDELKQSAKNGSK